MLLLTATPHVLDFAAGDRLAIGDQGEGLQLRAGIARLALLPQARHAVGISCARLKPEAARDFDQFDPALDVVLLQLCHGCPYRFAAGTAAAIGLVLEQLGQALEAERGVGDHDQRLE